MTLNISKYPEPDDYGEVLLRLMASPHLKPPPLFPGAETLPSAQPGDVLVLVGETIPDLSGSLYAREWLGLQSSAPQIAPDAAQYAANQVRHPISDKTRRNPRCAWHEGRWSRLRPVRYGCLKQSWYASCCRRLRGRLRSAISGT